MSLKELTLSELITKLIEEKYAQLEGHDENHPYPETDPEIKRKMRILEIQNEIDRRFPLPKE